MWPGLVKLKVSGSAFLRQSFSPVLNYCALCALRLLDYDCFSRSRVSSAVLQSVEWTFKRGFDSFRGSL
jgi:hypothetical protein